MIMITKKKKKAISMLNQSRIMLPQPNNLQ